MSQNQNHEGPENWHFLTRPLPRLSAAPGTLPTGGTTAFLKGNSAAVYLHGAAVGGNSRAVGGNSRAVGGNGSAVGGNGRSVGGNSGAVEGNGGAVGGNGGSVGVDGGSVGVDDASVGVDDGSVGADCRAAAIGSTSHARAICPNALSPQTARAVLGPDLCSFVFIRGHSSSVRVS